MGKVAPFTNMLTNYARHAYRANNSAADFIFHIARSAVGETIYGQILLLDLSKAFGEIERKHWAIIYEKGYHWNAPS